jgi:hypothetical protein
MENYGKLKSNIFDVSQQLFFKMDIVWRVKLRLKEGHLVGGNLKEVPLRMSRISLEQVDLWP